MCQTGSLPCSFGEEGKPQHKRLKTPERERGVCVHQRKLQLYNKLITNYNQNKNSHATSTIRPQQRVLFNQIRTISTMFKQSRRHCYVVVDVGVIVLFVFAASFFCFLLSLLVWSICCRSNLLFLRRPFSSSRTSLRSFRSN